MFRSGWFYFLALLAVGALVFSALLPAFQAEQAYASLLRDVRVNGYQFTDRDLSTCAHSASTSSAYVPGDEDSRGIWYLSASRTPSVALEEAGVVCFVPAELMQVFRARGARVTLDVRMRVDRPSRHFRVTLDAAGGNLTEWTIFPTTPDYREVTFDILDLGGDELSPGWLRIWPDLDGLNGMIEVRSVRVDVLAS